MCHGDVCHGDGVVDTLTLQCVNNSVPPTHKFNATARIECITILAVVFCFPIKLRVSKALFMLWQWQFSPCLKGLLTPDSYESIFYKEDIYQMTNLSFQYG